MVWARAPKIDSPWIGPVTWMPLAKCTGMPISWEISDASSSVRSVSLAQMASISSLRSAALLRDQEPKARRAARTAASTSSGKAAGTRAKGSSVAGLTSVEHSPLLAGTQRPSMKRLSY